MSIEGFPRKEEPEKTDWSEVDKLRRSTMTPEEIAENERGRKKLEELNHWFKKQKKAQEGDPEARAELKKETEEIVRKAAQKVGEKSSESKQKRRSMKDFLRARSDFEILGISTTATKEEFKKAHRRLVMDYHPDRNAGDKEAVEIFKMIQGAYERLEKKY